MNRPAAPAATVPPPARRGLLDRIERIGNALPNPATLFLALAVLVALLSSVCARLGVQAIHPSNGTVIVPVDLLTAAGVRRMFTEAVRNFVNFAPLGTVLVAMLGIGVAEATGLIGVALRALVAAIPRSMLTAAVVFLGVNANQAADAGIIFLPPVAALLFASAGRHPIAGIAAAFAGISGGFSANLLPSTLDVLLTGFTQAAVDASQLLPGYNVRVLGNWYFMAAATPLLTVAGTWVTHAWVEPRLGRWSPATLVPAGDAGTAAAHEAVAAPQATLAPDERRGLKAAGVALAVLVAVMLALTAFPGSPLRDPSRAGGIESLQPFFDSIVIWVLLVFLIPGIAYGIAARRIRSDHDVVRMTGEAMGTMGTYIVLAFCCAQFVSWFAWSNLATIVAISGAGFLRSSGLEGGLLLVAFIAFTIVLDFVTVSATAKWAVVAPVFVPMFALLGFTPEGTQAAYRIGDSCVNIVTPLMPYLPFILSTVQRYDRKAGPGTLVSLMLPYSVLFFVLWTALLLAFYAFGWPLGPGVGMRLGG